MNGFIWLRSKVNSQWNAPLSRFIISSNLWKVASAHYIIMMFTISIGLRSGWRQCFASQRKASLGLFWPAHPLQIVSCIFLSLVFKHRQVVCPCGSRPQVSLSSSSELRCSVFCVLRYVRLSCRGEIGECCAFSLHFDVSSTFTSLWESFCLALSVLFPHSIVADGISPTLAESHHWGLQTRVKQCNLSRGVWPLKVTQGLGKYFQNCLIAPLVC